MMHPITITSNRRIGAHKEMMFSFTNAHVEYYSSFPKKADVGQRIHVIYKFDNYGRGHESFEFDGAQWRQI